MQIYLPWDVTSFSDVAKQCCTGLGFLNRGIFEFSKLLDFALCKVLQTALFLKRCCTINVIVAKLLLEKHKIRHTKQ